ncbi:MAG: hypothetical protein PHE84_10540 [bacterium]|nr:hypothetical protein [bacterium]
MESIRNGGRVNKWLFLKSLLFRWRPHPGRRRKDGENMNALSANVAGKKIQVEWVEAPPEKRPAVMVTQTSLMEVIGAIDEVLEEEEIPAKDEFVAEVLDHLLATGRIKFKGRLTKCRFEIV